MPLAPTPPKGSSSCAKWISVLLMQAPPEMVRVSSSSARSVSRSK
jgi:hypothetical protein